MADRNWFVIVGPNPRTSAQGGDGKGKKSLDIPGTELN